MATFLKDLGAKPFIVPAMGSHGGGTAEGQREVLESYGITEAFTGVPIQASMDVIRVGTTPEGFPVYLDKHASEADHIGVVARVKPHTSYHGPIESGLMKMMMIGLGKHVGASWYHRVLLEQPYDQVVRSVGRTLAGQGADRLRLGRRRKRLRRNRPRRSRLARGLRSRRGETAWSMREGVAGPAAVSQADLLIIDEIGKEISGSGMDTNVVGRKRAFANAPPENQPTMRFIFVRGLSSKTHGNATGIGFADFTTTRLVKAMNYEATAINCLTTGYPEGANLPVHLTPTARCIDAALAILGTRLPEKARIMRIRDTLHLEEVEVSEPCMEELPKATQFTVEKGPYDMAFDAAGNLA